MPAGTILPASETATGSPKETLQQEREMTINWGPEPSNQSCTYAISTNIIKCKSYVSENKGNGFRFPPRAKAPLRWREDWPPL